MLPPEHFYGDCYKPDCHMCGCIDRAMERIREKIAGEIFKAVIKQEQMPDFVYEDGSLGRDDD